MRVNQAPTGVLLCATPEPLVSFVLQGKTTPLICRPWWPAWEAPLSRRMRVLVGLGVAVLGCGVYIWLFGVQTALALEARYVARKMPVVWDLPAELPDSSVSRSPGKKLSYFGYEFEVSWDDIDEAKSRTIGERKAIIAFRSGNVLSVWSGPPREFVNSVLSMGMDREAFRQMYGDEALQSDYALNRLMLTTTPDKITPFISKRSAASQSMLIVMKGISAPRGADSGIFAVNADGFRGFQYGHPPDSRWFSVELFADNGSLDFIFAQNADGPTVISQKDINRILQTLHKADANTVARSLSK